MERLWKGGVAPFTTVWSDSTSYGQSLTIDVTGIVYASRVDGVPNTFDTHACTSTRPFAADESDALGAWIPPGTIHLPFSLRQH
jgi:hypothetical protein